MLWNSSARSVRVGGILCRFAAFQVDHGLVIGKPRLAWFPGQSVNSSKVSEL